MSRESESQRELALRELALRELALRELALRELDRYLRGSEAELRAAERTGEIARLLLAIAPENDTDASELG